DTATGQWSVFSSPLTPWSLNSSVTTLLDGRILVTGGSPQESVCRILDPANAQWSPTTPLPEPKNFHTTTLLPDGRVFLVGATTSFIYTPSDQSWRPGPALTAPREHGAAVTLNDGRILIFGGYQDELGTSEIFDPVTGKITSTVRMPRKQYQPATTLLKNGRVLAAAGGNANQMTGPCAIYDPVSDRWVDGPPMDPSRRFGFPLVRLESGKILAAGGFDSANFRNGTRVVELLE
ncbi:MAG: Kelch repeat-containing protein, partial [Myxococcaceae bacterium]